MSTPAHALLSASASKRWLSCTPSARLESQFPDRAGEAAREGTLAHAIAEFYLKSYLSDAKAEPKIPEEFSADAMYSGSMLEYVREYTDLCIEKANAALVADPYAVIDVEKRIDYSQWAQNGFGTGDMVIVSSPLVEIVDLKYGKGVPVSAKDNTQMQMYALGIISAYYGLYEFEKVRMTIVQPRNGGVSEQEMTVAQLRRWGEEVVKPRAALAYKGEGELCAGSWCRFCKAAVRCRAYSDHCLRLAQMEFRAADMMTDDELSDALSRVDDLVSYANKLKEYALSEALAGRTWPGWKLVEGRSRRTYADTDAVMERLRDSGYERAFYMKPPELKSITELSKALGKKKFAHLLDGLIDKPPGKPALASVSDPRPEYNPAENEFSNLDE